MPERRFDIVLFGATGFTGGLTAEYLAANASAETRWALAGRNMSKLEDVRRRLAAQHPKAAELELLQADVTDADGITAVAEATKVVITTVGPYIHYGEPLVAACAAAGTDYVDLTGEPEFVDTMWLRHHDEARKNGARIIHSCGFDSIPYDLGVLYTIEQLPEGVPIRVEGFVQAGGTFSGGTYHSAINAFARVRQTIQAGRDRRQREPRPEGRKVHGAAGKPHSNASSGVGSSRSRRSIRRTSCAPRPGSSATVRTSPTATTWSPSACRRRSGSRSERVAPSPSPSCRRRAS